MVCEKRVALKASNGTAFTRLVRKIASAYQKMYTEEERTTSLPVESMMQRSNGACALTNRDKTDGMWGISGYYLCDLLLHALYYDPSRYRLVMFKTTLAPMPDRAANVPGWSMCRLPYHV